MIKAGVEGVVPLVEHGRSHVEAEGSHVDHVRVGKVEHVEVSESEHKHEVSVLDEGCPLDDI